MRLSLSTTSIGATLGDSTEAYELFCQSAAQGNANGEYALGLWYYLGDGGESDYEQALHWIRKAAEQGNEEAQEALERIADAIGH